MSIPFTFEFDVAESTTRHSPLTTRHRIPLTIHHSRRNCFAALAIHINSCSQISLMNTDFKNSHL